MGSTATETKGKPSSLDRDLALYEKVVLIRRSEEKIRSEYMKDEMKTPVHLGIGQEAIAAGVCAALPKNTKAFGTYRNHGIYLSMTDDLDGFFGELYGRATGCGKGKAGSMHMCLPEKGLVATSAVVATTIPVAVGAAFANKYRKSGDLAVVFFGDGAVEEGVFWESMNFAALHKLNILFVCEDNTLAIHTHVKDRQGFRSIPEAAKIYDCHVITGNGYDATEVFKLTQGALSLMKEDPKPAFLYLNYFRFLEHVGPAEDFPAGYRARPSEQELREKDPVSVLKKKLLAEGATEAQLAQIETRLQTRIDAAAVKAQAAPFPAPDELFKDVLA